MINSLISCGVRVMLNDGYQPEACSILHFASFSSVLMTNQSNARTLDLRNRLSALSCYDYAAKSVALIVFILKIHIMTQRVQAHSFADLHRHRSAASWTPNDHHQYLNGRKNSS